MNANPPTIEDMTWTGYVRATTGDTQAEIARTMRVSQPTVSRWFTKGAMPDPRTAATFARSYGRPVLEAFLAAGYLTPEEADQKPSATPSLAELSDDDLLDEVRRRMKGGQSGWSATGSPEDTTTDAGGGVTSPPTQDELARRREADRLAKIEADWLEQNPGMGTKAARTENDEDKGQ